ncbi:MAG TPA: hypothetical protein VF188_00470 [Longimicrobiales bacterium]
MSVFRGSRGFVALGGVVNGAPLVMGAVAQGATTATFDGTPLTGVLLAGDRFTVAGDPQVYTVTQNAVIGIPTANRVTVSFTPAVQVAGGWADNAAVLFVSNSLAEVTAWSATPARPVLDRTVMGDDARRIVLDIPGWSGNIEALFDYGDAEQKAFIDAVGSDSAPATVGLVLAVDTDKHLYGHVQPESAQVTGQRGALVTVQFTFQGEGALATDW